MGPTHQQDDEHRRRGQRHHDRLHAGVDVDERDLPAQQLGVLHLEAPRLLLFHGVGLDHPDARDRLLHVVRHLGQPLLDQQVARIHPRAEVAGDQDEARIGQDHERREQRVAVEHPGQRKEEQDGGLHSGQQSGPEQHPHRVQVVDATAHDVARAPAKVERLRQALEVRKQVVAHLVLDLTRRVEDEHS